MPWCPKCKTEYREGFKICSDCDSELLEQLEEVPDSKNDEDTEAFLISVQTSIDAEMLEDALNANGVPTMRKYKDAGEFLNVFMGTTISGVDLYVPSKLLSRAKEILDGCNTGIAAENGADSIEMVEDKEKLDIIDNVDIAEEAQIGRDADDIDNEEVQKRVKIRRAMGCAALVIIFPEFVYGIYYSITKLVDWIF